MSYPTRSTPSLATRTNRRPTHSQPTHLSAQQSRMNNPKMRPIAVRQETTTEILELPLYSARKGMQGKRNDVPEKQPPWRKSPPGPAGHFSRPDLVIPCWVARQQSPTPFHQAKTVYTTLKTKSAVPNHSFCPAFLRKRTLKQETRRLRSHCISRRATFSACKHRTGTMSDILACRWRVAARWNGAYDGWISFPRIPTRSVRAYARSVFRVRLASVSGRCGRHYAA